VGITEDDVEAHSKVQSQALQWCVEHEYPELPKTENDKPIQFWQYRKVGGKVSEVVPSITIVYSSLSHSLYT
jgi:hypothetical protein